MMFFPKSENFNFSSNLVFASSKVLFGLINPEFRCLQIFQHLHFLQAVLQKEGADRMLLLCFSNSKLTRTAVLLSLKLAKVVFPNAAWDPIFFPSLWRNLNAFCIVNALIHIHPHYYYKTLMSVLSKNKTPLHSTSPPTPTTKPLSSPFQQPNSSEGFFILIARLLPSHPTQVQLTFNEQP